MIVGYGPVGQTAAALLAGRGHRVAVYERFADLYGLPRAIYFDDEIMQVWQALGIVDQLDILPVAGYDGSSGRISSRAWSIRAQALGLGIGYTFHQPNLNGRSTRWCTGCRRRRSTEAGGRGVRARRRPREVMLRRVASRYGRALPGTDVRRAVT